MPRANRITCIGCDKTIDANLINRCSNNLFRLFLSARILKKVSFDDPVCRKCRWKFDNWVKKTNGEFKYLTGSDDVEKVMINICFGIS